MILKNIIKNHNQKYNKKSYHKSTIDINTN